MADIFLSYAREDLERARGLADALTAEGWDVFWDRRIPPGRSFEDYIESQIRDCRALVVLWSPYAVASDWVKIEASKGRSRRILIPVLIADAEIPFGYEHINASDLRGWTAGAGGLEFSVLVSAIEGLAPRKIPLARAGIVPISSAATTDAPEVTPLAGQTEVALPQQKDIGAKKKARDKPAGQRKTQKTGNERQATKALDDRLSDTPGRTGRPIGVTLLVVLGTSGLAIFLTETVAGYFTTDTDVVRVAAIAVGCLTAWLMVPWIKRTR